jgi:hypothetical protein
MFQPLDHLIASLQELKARVEAMPPGEDLERLIEKGIAQINQECYDMCLRARQESPVSSSGAFSPCDVSGVRRAAAPRNATPTPGLDASR